MENFMQVRWQRLTDLALRRRIARTLSVGLVLGLLTSVAAPNEMASSAITDPCPVKKIVYQGPITGPEAEIGVNQSAAARIAYNEVIRNFTYPNYKVIFVQADDQGSAAVAAPVAAKMASDPCVLGVIGPAFSGAAKVSLPYYLAAGIPVITPSATNLTLPNFGSSIFHGVTKSSADYFALLLRTTIPG
jgi:branched-chain amino acid transport system substrate-binding protein